MGALCLVQAVVEDADRIPDSFLTGARGYVESQYDPTDIRKQKRKEIHVAPGFLN